MITNAINSLAPNTKFVVLRTENSYEINWLDENIKQPTQAQIEEKIKELEIQSLIDEKSQAIEDHIYKNYSKDKQAQDTSWIANFKTKLVASGVNDIDIQIVSFTSSFLQGKKLSEILTKIDKQVKPMYEKLVKIAVKSEWTLSCVQEGKLAIAQNREPVYAEFPKFD